MSWTVTSPRWWQRSSLTSSPFIEQNVTTIPWQDTTERIPEHGDEAEAPPHIYIHTTETKRNCIEREEVATCSACWPSPGQCSITWSGLPWVYYSFRGRERLGGTSNPSFLVLGIAWWEPLLWSCPMGITGESAGLNYWESDCEREEGRSL